MMHASVTFMAQESPVDGQSLYSVAVIELTCRVMWLGCEPRAEERTGEMDLPGYLVRVRNVVSVAACTDACDVQIMYDRLMFLVSKIRYA